jgi:2-iminobutanoate/2-iminopropanoate deaminase
MAWLEAITVDEAPPPAGPYSHARAVGPLLFLSGQRPVHPVSGEIPVSLTDQVNQSLDNVSTVLGAAGASLSDIVKITVYLADLNDFSAMNEVLVRRFALPYPARTTVGARLRGVDVELDVIAVRPDHRF